MSWRSNIRTYRLALPLAIMASLGLLSSCANDNAENGAGTTEITFWAMGREGELAPELIQDFEAQNPDIKVRVQQIPWSAAHEQLLTGFAGDVLPDVAQMGNTWLSEFVTLARCTN